MAKSTERAAERFAQKKKKKKKKKKKSSGEDERGETGTKLFKTARDANVLHPNKNNIELTIPQILTSMHA